MNKKSFLLGVFIFIKAISFSIAQSNTIKISSVLPLSVCSGSSISVNIESTGTFGQNNMFNVELSAVNGSFSKPILLGSSKITGNILFRIPISTEAGTNYKIRVLSNIPAIISSEYAFPLEIKERPLYEFSVKGTSVPWNKNVFYLTNNDSIQYNMTKSNQFTNWYFGEDASLKSFIGKNPPFVQYKDSGTKTVAISNTIDNCTTNDTLGKNNFKIQVFSCSPILPPKALLIADSNRALIENIGKDKDFVLCRDALLSKAKFIQEVNLYLEEGANFYIKGSTNKSVIYNTVNASANIVSATNGRYFESTIINSSKSSLKFSPSSLKDSFAVLTCPSLRVDYSVNYTCLLGALCDTFDEIFLTIEGKDTVCAGETADYIIRVSGEKMRWHTSEAGNIIYQKDNIASVKWVLSGATTLNLIVRIGSCEYDVISKKSIFVKNLNQGGCITSINNHEEKKHLSINPNPVDEFMNIVSNSEIQEIQILDLLGKLHNTISGNASLIDMSILNKGFYLVAIQLKNGERKFLKIEKI
ncbi:MAG: T9SS C-terminal target domain-containing protein [Cytophagales bacterium]|nr:MAG: T9SS C-terminal target domain-containing protein [Cytophagales bacterium]